MPSLFGRIEEVFDSASYFGKDKYMGALFKYFKNYEEKDRGRPNRDDHDKVVPFFTDCRPPYPPESTLKLRPPYRAGCKEYKNTEIAESFGFMVKISLKEEF